jgi:hypothetical protein
VVDDVLPVSGPEAGLTQLTVTGENFVDLGRDSALCVFNKTVFTNATVMSTSEIICDTPSILNRQGYSELAARGGAAYTVDVSIDGGLQISDSDAKFHYYREPTVTGITPPSGPIKGGTTVVIHGQGFGQAAASKRLVRIGHLHVEPVSYTNDTLTIKAPAVPEASTTTVAVALNGQQFTRPPAVHNPSKSHTYDYYPEPYASLFYP